MTELGHGSNVAGCETTATFDEKTDTFIIDTPHIGATKWWIGGAAHSATHTVCYARLIVKDVDYGGKDICCPIEIQTTICCLVLLSVTLAPRWVNMVSITVGFNSEVKFQDFSCYKDGVKLTVR